MNHMKNKSILMIATITITTNTTTIIALQILNFYVRCAKFLMSVYAKNFINFFASFNEYNEMKYWCEEYQHKY